MDDGSEGLAELAVCLLRLRFDLFYASDHSEAWLLARQEAPRIGTLVVPVGLELDALRSLQGCLEGEAPGALRSVMVCGARPDDTAVARLREAGVRYGLWEPYDENTLRSAMGAALAGGDYSEMRRFPRVPTGLLGKAFVGARRKDVAVSNLSLGGAFLETSGPFPDGTSVTVDIGLPGAPLSLKARVVYAHFGDEERADQPAGMGVEFTGASTPDRDRIRACLAEQDRRFEL